MGTEDGVHESPSMFSFVDASHFLHSVFLEFYISLERFASPKLHKSSVSLVLLLFPVDRGKEIWLLGSKTGRETSGKVSQVLCCIYKDNWQVKASSGNNNFCITWVINRNLTEHLTKVHLR